MACKELDTLLVCGYTRQNYLYVNDVILLIILFFHISEEFIKCGIGLKIIQGFQLFPDVILDTFMNNNKWLYQVIDKRETESKSSVYGKINISTYDACVYEWLFKLGQNIYSLRDLYIGLTNTKDILINESLNDCYVTSSMISYAVSVHGNKLQIKNGTRNIDKVNDVEWKGNDIIKIKLDTNNNNNNILQFYCNNVLLTSFDGIKISAHDTLKMIVSTVCLNNLIAQDKNILSLIQFKCIHK